MLLRVLLVSSIIFSTVLPNVLLWPSLLRAEEKPFLLVLGLDGISFQIAEELYEAGFLRSFQRPIPMVATFPSISDPNWAKIIQAPLEKSYTKAYFDKTNNYDGSLGKEVGTIINHLIAPPQYEKAFDFKAEGIFQHLMSVTWSKTSALFWMESLSRLLLEPPKHDKNIYKAFIMNTDIISHVGGKKEIVDYLQKVQKRLAKLQISFKEKYKRPLEIVIISDHGNYYGEKDKHSTPKAIEFEKPLLQKGWTRKSTLTQMTDYGFVAPEIISFGAFYTLPKQEEPLASQFSEIEGVHVALVSRGNNRVAIFSKNGEAEVQVEPEAKRLTYKILKGDDPFLHAKYFATKSETSRSENKKTAPTKFLTFNEYFYLTLDDKYPNALVRAWEGFHNNSQESASVLVSPKLGYVFTNLTLEILTVLTGVRSSHGSFDREESLGIVLSTLKITDEAIAPHQFVDLIKNLGFALAD